MPSEVVCRLIQLQVEQHPTSEGAKKGERNQLSALLQHGSVVGEFLILGSGYIWHLKKKNKKQSIHIYIQ